MYTYTQTDTQMHTQRYTYPDTDTYPYIRNTYTKAHRLIQTHTHMYVTHRYTLVIKVINKVALLLIFPVSYLCLQFKYPQTTSSQYPAASSPPLQNNSGFSEKGNEDWSALPMLTDTKVRDSGCSISYMWLVCPGLTRPFHTWQPSRCCCEVTSYYHIRNEKIRPAFSFPGDDPVAVDLQQEEVIGPVELWGDPHAWRSPCVQISHVFDPFGVSWCVWSSFILLHVGLQFSSTISWQRFLSSSLCFWHLCQSSMAVVSCAHVWVFDLGPLSYKSGFVPVPYSLY